MMIDLARSLDLEVIAEGIETAEQAEELRVLESRFGQGFYLAAPAPEARLLDHWSSTAHPGSASRR